MNNPTYTFKGTHQTGPVRPIQDNGNWTAVYKRQGDGSWKCISSIGNSGNPLPGTTADGADEKALIQMEQDFAAAMTKGDTAVMDHFVAKEWVFRSPEGQLQTRAHFFGDIKTAYKISSVSMKNISPHIFGDFAIVSMIAELKGTYKGKDASGPQQSVDFCVRRDGRWQAVYSQNMAIN
jgi:ketosteroid isomerase-like protein